MKGMKKEDAIALAGAVAAKAVYRPSGDKTTEKAELEEAMKALNSIPKSEGVLSDGWRVGRRPGGHGLGRRSLRPVVLARISWGPNKERVRLVRRRGYKLSVEGDIAEAPKWVMHAIAAAAQELS